MYWVVDSKTNGVLSTHYTREVAQTRANALNFVTQSNQFIVHCTFAEETGETNAL